MRDAAAVVALAPQGGNRPFAVIDGGWQADGLGNVCVRAPGTARTAVSARRWRRWSSESAGWAPDRACGIGRSWLRPTSRPSGGCRATGGGSIPRFRRSAGRSPRTSPASRLGVRTDQTRLFDVDLTGRWGFQMGDNVTDDGWAFADRSRTSGRGGPGSLPHDPRGGGRRRPHFRLQHLQPPGGRHFRVARASATIRAARNGSGPARWASMPWPSARSSTAPSSRRTPTAWAWTTGHAPWAKNRQWLDLLARSGTPLFVSMRQSLLGDEQQRAIRAAFAVAARSQPLGEPLDWMDCLTPTRWRLMKEDVSFAW